MKMKYGLIIGFFIVAAGFQIGCKKEKVPPPFISAECPDTISYQNQIQPMLDVNCSTSGCHGASGAGGITLLTHFQVSDEANRVLKAMRHDSGVSNMPLGAPKLADSLANQMSCWINQGKMDN